MQYRELGKTGLRVSITGFGGIPIQRVSNEEAVEIVRKAKELGINFIDTARGYTNSEEKIGLAIAGDRDYWVLASKSMARDAVTFRRDLQTSLANLKVDYLDLYQFHNIASYEEYDRIFAEDGAYAEALRAQKEGLIHNIGITTHKNFIAVKAVESGMFSTIQVPFNAVESQFLEAIELAVKNGVGVIIMKPLAGGALRRADLALRFFLDYPISSVIPGMQSIEEVEANARVGNEAVKLNNEEREELREMAESLGNHFCRRCEYCLPCPQGIKIPSNFIFHGYLTRYNLQDWALDRYNSMTYKADDCIGCGVCESRCPYELPISEMLKEVARDFAQYQASK